MSQLHKSVQKNIFQIILPIIYMEDMKSLIKKISGYFSGNYKVLIVFLFLLFLLRPMVGYEWYRPIWKMIFTISLTAAIFNCNHRKSIKVICLVLGIPTMVFGWLNIYYAIPTVVIANALVTFSFLAICTYSILRDVVLRARVTLETLRGVICAYFMVAFAFAYAYYLIEYLMPGSFFLAREQITSSAYVEYLAQMIYFSFITLLTIGYGDIVPVKELGQTIVILEGILGQFYIAILVARIVAVYSISSVKWLAKKGKR